MRGDRTCENRSRCSSGIKCDATASSCRGGLNGTGRRELLGLIASGGTFALAGCVGAFGTPPSREAPRVGIDESFDIEFIAEEETVSIRGDRTLLAAGEAQGWELPYFCRTGFCGVCLSRVDGDTRELVEMSINQFEPLDEAAMEEGYTLTCTGYPRGDFAIETGLAGALDEVDEEPEEEIDEPNDEVTARTHTVDFVNERWTIEIPEDQSLLVAGEARGFDLPYRCRQGWCGECLGQIDGDTRDLVHLEVNDYEPLDDSALEAGYTLTCQGFPRGEFSLETGKFQEEEWPSGSPP